MPLSEFNKLTANLPEVHSWRQRVQTPLSYPAGCRPLRIESGLHFSQATFSPQHKSVVLRRFIENDIYKLCLSAQEIEMCLNAFKRNADIAEGDTEPKVKLTFLHSTISYHTTDSTPP
jgi:hypothetical protein